MKYPYIPKSNKSLRRGDYWLIELENGFFAVGIVVDIPPPELKLKMEFIAGLLNWKGNETPKITDLKNLKIIKQGKAHIKTIEYTGGELLGNINFKSYKIEPMLQRSQGEFQLGAQIVKGYQDIRNMEPEDIEKYSVLGTWGYNYIRLLAEKI